MTQKSDGGPAYPQSETLYEDGAELVRDAHGGMSMHSYFAGQALIGVAQHLAQLISDDEISTPETIQSGCDAAARLALMIADSMIAKTGETK